MSRTAATNTSNVSTFYVRVPKRSNRLAAAYLWYLEQVCQKTGHVGACVLLNSWHRGGPVGRLWHRVVGRLNDAASDGRWEAA